MKHYLRPELEIELFDEEDVIVCSGGDGNDDDIPLWYLPEEEDE